MNEGKNKREWVKNVAIIFLSVLLVLTFFSNTIMNYSLPEVAAQYVESGTITAKIRGTGTIESGDPYYVTIEKQRKVEAVNVRPGDVVMEGDVLAVLSVQESADMEAAKAELEAAEKAFDDYLLSGSVDISVMNNAGSAESVNSYMKKITNLKNQIEAGETVLADYDRKITEVQNWKNALETQISMNTSEMNNLSIYTVGEEEERKAYLDAEAKYNSAKSKLEQLEIDKSYYDSLVDSVSDSDAKNQEEATRLEKEVIVAKKECDNAEKNMNDKKAVLDSQMQEKKTELQNSNSNLAGQVRDQDGALVNLQNERTLKNNEVVKLQAEYESLVANIADARQLETLNDAIEKAKAKVDELQSDDVPTEVLAPFNGTIVSVAVTSGTDTVTQPENGKGYTIVTMQREGSGYTMEFAVTNQQAQQISVGDEAEVVNSWRYDNMSLTVSGIKNDLTNPGQGKIITLDVRGDYITPGQNLSVSVGEKSASYDMIVPNSAIREDNNGKFVLVVESKSSPLGNRYIATRADVNVIASDDTKSAITGDLYVWGYVITTSTAPVEAGQQVRLAEN